MSQSRPLRISANPFAACRRLASLGRLGPALAATAFRPRRFATDAALPPAFSAWMASTASPPQNLPIGVAFLRRLALAFRRRIPSPLALCQLAGSRPSGSL